jgi:hypothetical protein
METGHVPAGVEAEYWVGWFLRSLPSRELGLQAALVEAARHSSLCARSNAGLVAPLVVAAAAMAGQGQGQEHPRATMLSEYGDAAVAAFIARFG